MASTGGIGGAPTSSGAQGGKGVPDVVAAAIQRFRDKPDAANAVAACTALATHAPSAPEVVEIGEMAQALHEEAADVLVAVAQMYAVAGRHAEAQVLLVSAGKLAPRDARVYRWLGEVLLRRGDAARAEKVLERSLQLKADDDTRRWLDRAQVWKPLQERSGEGAVAAELARTPSLLPPEPAPPPRPSAASTTEVKAVEAPMDLAATEEAPAVVPRPPMASVSDEETAEIRPDLLAAASGRAPFDSRDETTQVRPEVAPLLRTGTPEDGPRFVPAPAVTPRPPPFPPTQITRGVDEASYGSLGMSGPVPARDALGPPPVDAFASRHPAPLARPALGGPPMAAVSEVLDALTLVGIFEPQIAGAPVPSPWDRPTPSKRRGSLAIVSMLMVFVAVSTGLYGWIRHRRIVAHQEAEVILARVELELLAGRAANLDALERDLARTFELDSRSPRAALAWTRERVLAGLVRGGADIAFESALARAREVGVGEEQLAFARVASFLFQGDTAGAAALLGKLDAEAGQDAWYQLVAGATLEQAGDPRAEERYLAAQRRAPQLVAAEVALVRLVALEGPSSRAAELAANFRQRYPDRAEGAALLALAWARLPAHTEVPAAVEEARARAAELPRMLRAVPPAALALRASLKREGDDVKRSALARALAAADGPAMATWVGSLALETGDEATARRAALAAVQFSGAYPPARVLAARVALAGDHLEEARKAVGELDGTAPEVAVVRLATAYEHCDVDGLQRSIDPLPLDAKRLTFLAGLLASPQVLVGRRPSPLPQLEALDPKEAPWADVLAMDAALDAGDLEAAARVEARWKEEAGADPAARPSRAVRLARLARYQEHLESADLFSQAGLAHGPTVRGLLERSLVLVARGRAAEVAPLLSRHGALLGSMATWISAYAAAASGRLDEARTRTASLEAPPQGASLPLRSVAALALGATHDRRAADVLRGLEASGFANKDTALPSGPAPATPTPGRVRGRR